MTTTSAKKTVKTKKTTTSAAKSKPASKAKPAAKAKQASKSKAITESKSAPKTKNKPPSQTKQSGATSDFTILINGKSGFVLNKGEDFIKQTIVDSGLTSAKNTHFLAPEKLDKKLSSLKKGEDIGLLIGGGDGTIRSCAAKLLEKDIPFGILPMGTMNLLAQDLDIPDTLEEAIKAYQDSAVKGSLHKYTIDAAFANDALFLCCAGIGIMPEASDYREKLRENNDITMYPKLTAFILERMDTRHFKSLILDMPSARIKLRTASLVVSNNRFQHSTAIGDNQFKKQSLQDGELGIYALEPQNWFETLRFMIKLGLKGWKNDAVMREWSAPQVRVITKGKKELVSLDGEPIEMQAPVEFSVRPMALEVLVPAQS